MATPCRKCGATKTEPVYHGFFYNLAKRYGYRLCECSRCRRKRLIPRAAPSEADTGEPVTPPPTPPAVPQTPLQVARETKHHSEIKCPKCGKSDYRRSKRTWWEHVSGKPPMLRCRACRFRFPKPGKASHVAR